MTVGILGGGTASLDEVEKLKVRPEFRKATLNMMLSFVAVEKALAQLPKSEYEKLGMVFGSSLGELDVTKDFLVTLADTGVARPFLFQNSLHNATPGFLCLQYGIQGPTATVSTKENTSEDGIELAMSWLEAGLCKNILLVMVETCPEVLRSIAQNLLPSTVKLSDGAAAICLTNDLGFSGKKLVSVERVREGAIQLPEKFNDCISLQNLAERFNQSDRITNYKPNGSFSVFHLA